jgi:hypothetical protein
MVNCKEELCQVSPVTNPTTHVYIGTSPLGHDYFDCGIVKSMIALYQFNHIVTI